MAKPQVANPALRYTPVIVPPQHLAPSFSRAARDNDDSRDGDERHNGSYRTVCVRLCDGSFFPISFRASRRNFTADSEAGHARCGMSESRLFYYPNSGDLSQAVDLGGLSYKSLPTAFLFRKTLVNGCACKPAPWTEAEIERHRGYAVAEGRIQPPPHQQAVAFAGGSSSAVVVAGNYPQPAPEPLKADPEVVQREEPVTRSDDPMVANIPMPAEPVPQIPTRQLRIAEYPSSRSAPVEPEPRKTGKPEARVKHEAAERAPKGRTATKSRKIEAIVAAQQPLNKPKMSGSTAMFLTGSGGGKMVWPGDGPSRYR